LRLLRCLAVVGLLAAECPAQLPDYYKTVNRVTWVVGNIDKVRQAWEAFGLSDIQEYPNIQLVGQFRGKPVTIYAWQITGRLGNLTVDMIQPAEAQANAYTNFLGRHGDGILSIVHQVRSRQTGAADLERHIGKHREQPLHVADKRLTAERATRRRVGVCPVRSHGGEHRLRIATIPAVEVTLRNANGIHAVLHFPRVTAACSSARAPLRMFRIA